jgi:hypothetical protein
MLPDWPRFLSLSLAAAYLGVSPSVFLAEVKSGMWPKPCRRGKSGGLLTWDRAALDQAADRLNGTVPPIAPDEDEINLHLELHIREIIARRKAEKEAQLEEWRLKREAKQQAKDERQRAREARKAEREQEKAAAVAARAEREAQRALVPQDQQDAIAERIRLHRLASDARRQERRLDSETREQVRARWAAAAAAEVLDTTDGAVGQRQARARILTASGDSAAKSPGAP